MRIHVSGLAWSALLLLTLAACDGGTPAEPSPAADPELVKEATPAKTTDQIEIRLDVQPNDAQDLAFRMSGAKSASFALDDDADALVRNFKVFPSLKAGAYAVTLPSPPLRYNVTSITCTSTPNGGAGVNNNTINIPARSVTIQLEARERAVCTFVVAVAEPRLTVTINQAPGQQEPAFPGDRVYFTVAFNNPVTSFTAEDVAISASGAWVGSIDQQGDGSYLVGVDTWFEDPVTATIPAGGVTDIYGQVNEASTSSDNTVDMVTGDQTECLDDGVPDGGPTCVS